jgi:hypothetical protein
MCTRRVEADGVAELAVRKIRFHPCRLRCELNRIPLTGRGEGYRICTSYLEGSNIGCEEEKYFENEPRFGSFFNFFGKGHIVVFLVSKIEKKGQRIEK